MNNQAQSCLLLSYYPSGALWSQAAGLPVVPRVSNSRMRGRALLWNRQTRPPFKIRFKAVLFDEMYSYYFIRWSWTIPQLCCYRFGLLVDFPQCTENFLSTSLFMCLYATAASSNLWFFFFRVRNGEFSLFFFPLPNRRQWGQRSTLVMHHFQQHETDLYPKLYFSIVKRSRVGMHELEVEMGTSFEGEQEYHSCIFLLRAAVEYDFLSL